MTPQPGSGQVPTYYVGIRIIIIQKKFCSTWHHSSLVDFNGYICRILDSSFMALATYKLHSLFESYRLQGRPAINVTR